MNLTTALSTRRAKEVGVRKVVGSHRIDLIRQFIGESVFLSFIGLILSLIIIEIVLPYFNNLIGKDLHLYQFSNWQIILILPLLILFVGLIAGSYPATYLSAFKPIRVIQGILVSGKEKSNVRNILVLLQFIISTALIICTGSIYHQLNYIKQKDLGYNNKNILVVPLVSDEAKGKYELILSEIKSIPGVLNASASSDYPGHGFTSNGYIPEGQEKPIMINVIDVDYDFLNTLGLDISRGRNFSRNFVTDKNVYLVNESLINKMNWKNPIGKTISRGGDHEVIGVVKDFHFATLYDRIAPLIFTMKPYIGFNCIVVNPEKGNIVSTLNLLREKWQVIVPNEQFDYFFLEDEFRRVYKPELKFGELLIYFTLLAISIACMGLFGLASFMTEQRSKEVGIRKAMGATGIKIATLFSRDFTRLVLISNIFAWPAAFYFINKWLQNFAYRIDFPVGIFLATSVVTFLIAIFTVSYQSIRVANINPVESLKYE
jgi:putative ABC transport system permease protein